MNFDQILVARYDPSISSLPPIEKVPEYLSFAHRNKYPELWLNSEQIVTSDDGVYHINRLDSQSNIINAAAIRFMIAHCNSAIGDNDELVQFWNSNKDRLARMSLKSTYYNVLDQAKFWIINNSVNRLGRMAWYFGIIDNLKYNPEADHTAMCTISDLWASRYEQAQSLDVDMLMGASWYDEIDTPEHHAFFDSCIDDINIHEEYRNIISRVIGQEESV